MDNKSIIKQLKLLAALMELHDENGFKIRGYQNAIFNLEKFEPALSKMSEEELSALEGVGKSIAKSIYDLVQTGTTAALEEFQERTPEGIIELLNLKGIGPKKIKVLWRELGIESGYELKEAATTGKVADLKGFGEKTQQKILDLLAFKEANAHKLHYAEAEKLAETLMDELQSCDAIEEVQVTGSLRRQLETADAITLLAATKDYDQLEKEISALADFKQQQEISGPVTWRGFYAAALIPIVIQFCRPETLVQQQLLLTGSVGHLRARVDEKKTLRDLAFEKTYDSETEFYAAAGWPYVPPELREGHFEIEAAKRDRLPKLVEMEDLKGILHNHSTYSDGRHSLKEMAEYCKSLGYEYLGICDHSQSAFYANGLNKERVEKQQEEIDKLNESLKPFKILKGIESDILNDGALDYDENVLASFDFIVASIHSNLNMPKQKATERLLKAINNPFTTILGHPTGRLLLRREGYPIDHKVIIDACATAGVAIEINANPWRLDLDWRWVNYALEQKVKIAINPDAHSKDGYHDMRYGVLVGRKGGLTADMTLNAMSLKDIEMYFGEHKKKRLNG